MGLIGSSVLSGQYISRTGRYRFFPIVGTGLMAIGMLMLSQLHPETGLLASSVYMAVMGVGVGMVISVIVLAVQNSVDHEYMGTATAATNFFRSMGAAFGVAIAGAIIDNRLGVYLPQLVNTQDLQGKDPKVLMAAPEQLYQLPPNVVHGVAEAFSKSVDIAFLACVPLAVLAFALTWLLRESPLRETAHVGSSREAIALEERQIQAEPLI
jgi:MFS family permease